MEFIYDQTDFSEGIIVSGIALVLFSLFYLYKKRNKYIISILVWFDKPPKTELKKDTRNEDWFLFLVLLAAVVFLGLKLVTLMVVVSNSMVPEFERGDMILTQSIDKTPKVGDIITFNVQNENIAISHRVIELRDGLIITKGDNNPSPDDYGTTEKNIVAKVIQINNRPVVIPGLGSLFITDYSKDGVIYKFGDRFTFLQQLSATLRVWGFVITILAICMYALLVLRK